MAGKRAPQLGVVPKSKDRELLAQHVETVRSMLVHVDDTAERLRRILTVLEGKKEATSLSAQDINTLHLITDDLEAIRRVILPNG